MSGRPGPGRWLVAGGILVIPGLIVTLATHIADPTPAEWRLAGFVAASVRSHARNTKS